MSLPTTSTTTTPRAGEGAVTTGGRRLAILPVPTSMLTPPPASPARRATSTPSPAGCDALGASAACAICLLPLSEPSIAVTDVVGAAAAAGAGGSDSTAAAPCAAVPTVVRMQCCSASVHLDCVGRVVTQRGVRKRCCGCQTEMSAAACAAIEAERLRERRAAALGVAAFFATA